MFFCFFFKNYNHSKHAFRTLIIYVPILLLVSFWQHSIHIQQTISELKDLETTTPPSSNWLVICQYDTNTD